MATITSRRFPDGKFYRRVDDGPWELEPDMPLLGPNFPAGEPVYDPENPPIEPGRMKRIAFAKHLRFKLGLTQEQFAERYRIPIGTLRDWEQHRTEPDAPAKAYLKLISADPEDAANKLAKIAAE